MRYGGTFDNGVAARAYVKASDRDSLKNTNGSDGVDDARFAQSGVRVDWGAAGADRWTAQGDFYQGEESGVFQTDFTLGTLPAGTRVDETSLSGGNVLMRWEHELGSGGDFSLQSYYDRTRRDIPQTYDERRDTFDLDFQHRLRAVGSHDLLWGAGFRSTEDEIDNTLFATFTPAERRDETTQRVSTGQDRHQGRADVPDARLQVRAQRLHGLRGPTERALLVDDRRPPLVLERDLARRADPGAPRLRPAVVGAPRPSRDPALCVG